MPREQLQMKTPCSNNSCIPVRKTEGSFDKRVIERVSTPGQPSTKHAYVGHARGGHSGSSRLPGTYPTYKRRRKYSLKECQQADGMSYPVRHSGTPRLPCTYPTYKHRRKYVLKEFQQADGMRTRGRYIPTYIQTIRYKPFYH